MDWLSEAAAQTKARVGLPWGAEPTSEAVVDMVDLFRDRITLRYKHIPEAVCFHRPDETATIYIPAYLSGRPHAFTVAHELGHALWDNRLGDYLIQQGDPALARLGRYVKWTNERQANTWVAALFGRHLARH